MRKVALILGSQNGDGSCGGGEELLEQFSGCGDSSCCGGGSSGDGEGLEEQMGGSGDGGSPRSGSGLTVETAMNILVVVLVEG